MLPPTAGPSSNSRVTWIRGLSVPPSRSAGPIVHTVITLNRITMTLLPYIYFSSCSMILGIYAISVGLAISTDPWAEIEPLDFADGDDIDSHSYVPEPLVALPDILDHWGQAHGPGVGGTERADINDMHFDEEILTPPDIVVDQAFADTDPEDPVQPGSAPKSRASPNWSPDTFEHERSTSDPDSEEECGSRSEVEELAAPIVKSPRRVKRRRVSVVGRKPTPPSTTGPPREAITVHEKRVCLEALVGRPDMTLGDFLCQIKKRIPAAGDNMLIRFRKHIQLKSQVKPWFHQFLLSRANTTENDYKRLAAEARSVGEALGAPHCPRMVSAVREWMEFCIKPLCAHHGPESDIIEQSRPRKHKDEVVRLAIGPLRTFLSRQLQSLSGKPFKWVGPVATTIAPPRTHKFGSARAARARKVKARTPPDGLSLTVRRAILEVMMEHSGEPSSAFFARVHAMFPHVEKKRVVEFRVNAYSSTVVAGWMHDYLLNRTAISWEPDMAAELDALAITNRGSPLCKSPQGTVRRWIKYCIIPLLADPGATPPPCVPETRSGEQFMRLSRPQQRILFADMASDLAEQQELSQ